MRIDRHRDVVYVDVDGVLTEHNRTFLNQLNKIAGTRYRYEDITSFIYHECFPEEHADMMLKMWHSETMYDMWPPEPGAIEAVEAMRSFARIIALSSPMAGHLNSKYQWLLEHGFSRENIFFATDKSLARGAVLIDDRVENLLDFQGTRICFPRPWNTYWDTSLGIRTANWDEIVEEARNALMRNGTI